MHLTLPSSVAISDLRDTRGRIRVATPGRRWASPATIAGIDTSERDAVAARKPDELAQHDALADAVLGAAHDVQSSGSDGHDRSSGHGCERTTPGSRLRASARGRGHCRLGA